MKEKYDFGTIISSKAQSFSPSQIQGVPIDGMYPVMVNYMPSPQRRAPTDTAESPNTFRSEMSPMSEGQKENQMALVKYEKPLYEQLFKQSIGVGLSEGSLMENTQSLPSGRMNRKTLDISRRNPCPRFFSKDYTRF